MKQFLLSVHGVQGAPMPDPETMQRMFDGVNAFNDEVRAAGAWVFAGGLMPVETARVVRTETGEPVVTDGPFAESKEHLGGFWVIAAADDEQALAWSEKASRACLNPVEVRPFQEEPA